MDTISESERYRETPAHSISVHVAVRTAQCVHRNRFLKELERGAYALNEFFVAERFKLSLRIMNVIDID